MDFAGWFSDISPGEGKHREGLGGMGRVTKKDIIDIVSRQTGYKKNHTKDIVEKVLQVFMERLSEDRRMEIRNFGVFKVKRTPRRIGRNPVTKEVADVPARNIVQFKAGKLMKEWVNNPEAVRQSPESFREPEDD